SAKAECKRLERDCSLGNAGQKLKFLSDTININDHDFTLPQEHTFWYEHRQETNYACANKDEACSHAREICAKEHKPF
ncbi:MAG: hypothetical protein LE168_05445, partial [Endomicrobium sp.]|nr:hypothetical protein [Endomicrobium sp.]